MTQKVEVIGDSLSGPYTIKIDGKVITGVESYDLCQDEGVHKLTMTLITDNFELKRSKVK